MGASSELVGDRQDLVTKPGGQLMGRENALETVIRLTPTWSAMVCSVTRAMVGCSACLLAHPLRAPGCALPVVPAL